MPEANELETALAVVVTDPPHEVDAGDLEVVPVVNGHHVNGNGNGHAVHVNGNGNGNGVYANGNGNGNGHHPNGAAVYANGVTNGHAILVNGNGHTNGNGYANGNGHSRSSLNLTARTGIFERNGNGIAASNGNGSYTRLAVLDMPGELPVALPWLGGTEANPTSVYLRYGKRAMDVMIAGLSLLFLSPLFALLALLIKIDSRGPVFYKSKRLGRNGRPFTFYKFRSMYVGAHEDRHKVEHLNEKTDGPVFKISSDPRTTRIGRFIRQTSLDELPQLANVLTGQMTLVGPRPPLPEEVAQYQSWHRRRLEVKPGITCLWQISGRSRLGFNEWMRLDLEYIKRQSFATDVKILLRTLPAVVSREGAY
jgi:lipopolysaccharide/colanic/teichoic acid biosynthesis glycosyltransferase